MDKKWTPHIIAAGAFAVFIVLGLACGSSEPAVRSKADSTTKKQSHQKTETQLEKYQRLYLADGEKLVRGSDNQVTIKSIEAVFQPQVITRLDEITADMLTEPGRPYYFKVRALYKGHDAKAERVLLQDLGEQSSVGDAVFATAFGIDTDVYEVRYFNSVIETFPENANAVATFYLVAARFTENEGRQINESYVYIRFVRNIEPPLFNPSKFIVANGMHYITVNDAHVTTQEDVMAHYFLGGTVGNSSSSVFDPIVYPLVDLMDARVAMDKKDLRNDYTLPRVKVKYASEVIFKGQSNTTITVSTSDNVLTEKMNFTGRASSVRNGARVFIYYTIAKDPLEKWEIQAIEQF